MLSGSAIARSKYAINYNAWFSARSGNEQFNSKRSSGGRASLYLPESRLEVGLSYDRQLQRVQENFYGAYAWWEPKDTAFRLRSEFARGHHAQGYWVEADYRTQAFGGLDSWVGRFEPVFRMQQTFRRDTIVSDGLPFVNTQRADFGLDYNLPHNTRILTSYSRQFSAPAITMFGRRESSIAFSFPLGRGSPNELWPVPRGRAVTLTPVVAVCSAGLEASVPEITGQLHTTSFCGRLVSAPKNKGSTQWARKPLQKY